MYDNWPGMPFITLMTTVKHSNSATHCGMSAVSAFTTKVSERMGSVSAYCVPEHFRMPFTGDIFGTIMIRDRLLRLNPRTVTAEGGNNEDNELLALPTT